MTSRTSNPRPRAVGRLITKLLTIDEVAEVLNVSPRTVRRLTETGGLRVHRLGRLVRISDDDLALFLAANRSE
jgi:excisionase family DNA binding protein